MKGGVKMGLKNKRNSEGKLISQHDRPKPCALCHNTVMAGQAYEWLKQGYSRSCVHRECWEKDRSGDSTTRPKFHPPPNPAPAGLGALDTIIESTIEQKLATKLADELAPLREEIKAASESGGVTNVKVDLARPDGKIEVKDVGLVHEQFTRVLEWIKAGDHVYAWGPSGSGKSTVGFQVGESLGLQVAYFALQPGTPDSRLLGFRDATGKVHTTGLHEVFEKGGILLLDEADNMSDSMLTQLNGMLSNGVFTFPSGLQVEKHVDFRCFATGNTGGYGGSLNHAGRRAFDSATADRFVFIKMDYDPAMEKAAVVARNDSATALEWLQFVREVRACAKDHCPRLVVTPRAAFRGVEYLKRLGHEASTEELATLASEVVFKGLKDSERDTILGQLPNYRGSK
jgi:hypothetical protein